ncbi:Phosphotransferase enzyme family protein [Paenibacillus konkukensis]|uniref:Phosphotransferase enzyme family protein n=1 Tax=Paenibacillus konkukensis TaxID=2020716 RepID=A0ABY4RTQ1_9BACL|nr:phosphotransferase [Paenibacillus konkukensis]UQZ85605.1 Phosphotransferase enzyme family protein [Paenibacillus konkukensis]
MPDDANCIKEILLQYPFIDPVVEFIRHNENITYKVTEKGSEDAYLLRIHKPITKNMQGVQNRREAIQSELEYLLAWSSCSELPVQIPVPNLNGDVVSSVVLEGEEVYCSVLKWICGETMSRSDFASEEMASTLGERVAQLHQFSRSFKPSSGFIRPEYEIAWINNMLTKLRSGENMGVILSGEFQIIEKAFPPIIDRMKSWSKSIETWGFIHADIHYSNFIRTSRGISFIDFGLSGFGYYAMDVAMSALFIKSELRDDLLSGYTKVIAGNIDVAQLEDLMFLNICEYYAFLVSRREKHLWIREHMPSLIELCRSLLQGTPVFYRMNQVGLAN